MNQNSEEKIIIKIKYGRILYHITSDTKRKLSFHKLFQILAKSFKIKKHYIKCLELSDECGTVFERKTFELYIKLFPAPKHIFHLKINFKKLAKAIRKNDEKLEPLMTLRERCEIGTPVFRQNCFIGAYPKFTSVESIKVESFDVPILKRNRFNVIRQKYLRI